MRLHVEGFQHFRSVGEDREIRGDDARPENTDEDRAPPLTLAEQLAVAFPVHRLLAELFGGEVFRTHVLFDDLTCFGLTAVTQQPARGFWKTDSQPEHNEGWDY